MRNKNNYGWFGKNTANKFLVTNSMCCNEYCNVTKINKKGGPI